MELYELGRQGVVRFSIACNGPAGGGCTGLWVRINSWIHAKPVQHADFVMARRNNATLLDIVWHFSLLLPSSRDGAQSKSPGTGLISPSIMEISLLLQRCLKKAVASDSRRPQDKRLFINNGFVADRDSSRDFAGDGYRRAESGMTRLINDCRRLSTFDCGKAFSIQSAGSLKHDDTLRSVKRFRKFPP